MVVTTTKIIIIENASGTICVCVRIVSFMWKEKSNGKCFAISDSVKQCHADDSIEIIFQKKKNSNTFCRMMIFILFNNKKLHGRAHTHTHNLLLQWSCCLTSLSYGRHQIHKNPHFLPTVVAMVPKHLKSIQLLVRFTVSRTWIRIVFLSDFLLL